MLLTGGEIERTGDWVLGMNGRSYRLCWSG